MDTPTDIHAQLDDVGQRHAANRDALERANAAVRDLRATAEPLIIAALRADVGPSEIHRRTGYSRQTINTIREAASIPLARPTRDASARGEEAK